jgi:hypothetical protein
LQKEKANSIHAIQFQQAFAGSASGPIQADKAEQAVQNSITRGTPERAPQACPRQRRPGPTRSPPHSSSVPPSRTVTPREPTRGVREKNGVFQRLPHLHHPRHRGGTPPPLPPPRRRTAPQCPLLRGGRRYLGRRRVVPGHVEEGGGAGAAVGGARVPAPGAPSRRGGRGAGSGAGRGRREADGAVRGDAAGAAGGARPRAAPPGHRPRRGRPRRRARRTQGAARSIPVAGAAVPAPDAAAGAGDGYQRGGIGRPQWSEEIGSELPAGGAGEIGGRYFSPHWVYIATTSSVCERTTCFMALFSFST